MHILMIRNADAISFPNGPMDAGKSDDMRRPAHDWLPSPLPVRNPAAMPPPARLPACDTLRRTGLRQSERAGKATAPRLTQAV